MKKTIFRIALILLAVVLTAAAVLVFVGMRQGIRFSEARYIETAHGHMLLIDGSPISMSGKDSLFKNLTTGDRVLVAHGLIAESYPGQAEAYLCIKLKDGVEQNIDENVIASLGELGWLPYLLLTDENQAIAIADRYASFDYYAATAERDAQTGDWTVTFWSKDRETFQILTIDDSTCKITSNESNFPYIAD